jgi:hypothetical protein
MVQYYKISWSNNKFHVIEPPVGLGGDLRIGYCSQLYLGRPEKEVLHHLLIDGFTFGSLTNHVVI